MSGPAPSNISAFGAELTEKNAKYIFRASE